jgi:type IV conjugative transfer system protein TraL
MADDKFKVTTAYNAIKEPIRWFGLQMKSELIPMVFCAILMFAILGSVYGILIGAIGWLIAIKYLISKYGNHFWIYAMYWYGGKHAEKMLKRTPGAHRRHFIGRQ